MPMTPQVNNQRNAITSALMKIANPPPQRPPMPQLSAANTMPQQQPLGQPNMGPQVAPPGSLPMGMPQDPAPGQPGAFPTPSTNPTAATPYTPMASAPGAQQQPSGGAQQGMMSPQPQGQTGRPGM